MRRDGSRVQGESVLPQLQKAAEDTVVPKLPCSRNGKAITHHKNIKNILTHIFTLGITASQEPVSQEMKSTT